MAAILRDWSTTGNRLRAAFARGKPPTLTAGSWLADLAALRKCITLCRLCRNRWNAKTNGYEQREAVPGHAELIGECDGCKARATMCATYFPKEKH
ncbi:MAG: hypothetical protein AB7Q01_14090 [Gammaproteobacteria bacterium]